MKIRGFRVAVMALHFAVIWSSVLAASWIWLGPSWYDTLVVALGIPFQALALYGVVGVVILDLSGLYRFDKRWSIAGKLVDVTRGVVALAIITLVLVFFLNLDDVSRGLVAISFVLMWTGVALATLAVRAYLVWRRDRGRGVQHAIVVGTGAEAHMFVNDITRDHPELGIDVIGYLTAKGSDWDPSPVLGTIHDLADVLATEIVDEVLVALPMSEWATVDSVARTAEEQGKTVRVPLFSGDYAVSRGQIEHLSGTPVLTIETNRSHTLGVAIKRLTDILVSAVALILLAPVMAAIALVIRLTDGRPLIYGDQRAGIHGRPILIHKFRTMIPNANELRNTFAAQNDRVGPDFKIVDDPRTTRVGRFLRRTSLDELPQFWDILTGSLSLVGPRAQRLDEVAGYDHWHRRRLSVKPGLTGLWQVKARQNPSFEVRANLDLEYIDSWSPLLDLQIAVATIPALLKSTGN
jgi:exopolysaccharide biosynthesis polyprenyl glycosylphosphotransferase